MQLVGPKCNILLCKYIPQPQECGSLYNIPVYNASQWSARDPYSAIKNQSYATFSLHNWTIITPFWNFCYIAGGQALVVLGADRLAGYPSLELLCQAWLNHWVELLSLYGWTKGLVWIVPSVVPVRLWTPCLEVPCIVWLCFQGQIFHVKPWTWGKRS